MSGEIAEREFRRMQNALRDARRIIDSTLVDCYHGCITGDCPHSNQMECDAALAADATSALAEYAKEEDSSAAADPIGQLKYAEAQASHAAPPGATALAQFVAMVDDCKQKVLNGNTEKMALEKAIEFAADQLCDAFETGSEARSTAHNDLDRQRANRAFATWNAMNEMLRAAQREQEELRRPADATAHVPSINCCAEAVRAREERDADRAELARIDAVLSNRTALEDKGSRADKIMHAINTAKEVDPLRAEVERLGALTGRLKTERDALGTAIVEEAKKLGITHGDVGLTGPQVLLLLAEIGKSTTELVTLRWAYSEFTKLEALRNGAATFGDHIPANRSTLVARIDEILALMIK